LVQSKLSTKKKGSATKGKIGKGCAPAVIKDDGDGEEDAVLALDANAEEQENQDANQKGGKRKLMGRLTFTMPTRVSVIGRKGSGGRKASASERKGSGVEGSGVVIDTPPTEVRTEGLTKEGDGSKPRTSSSLMQMASSFMSSLTGGGGASDKSTDKNGISSPQGADINANELAAAGAAPADGGELTAPPSATIGTNKVQIKF
jgi:hypothetical protein